MLINSPRAQASGTVSCVKAHLCSLTELLSLPLCLCLQSCIISGESGAGKTEASNILVHHFMRLGKAESRSLEDKILQVNPLMEAFGNARTVINGNSSRFGKYLELYFSPSGHIQGGNNCIRMMHNCIGMMHFQSMYVCVLSGFYLQVQL